ncbi:hypothetical protein GA840_00315 [Pediococcus ethanolidurans]|uniref:hypothetical protein n=1 Tax=Pediococcus ethanolidurans TaxID=319653 RepID=UPI002954936E|nr:hypothetical protein [Pediococcus ethanolidurans]MDV7718331.1 hypothetical protein [Pediococcus ethanolidurans]
MSKHRKKQPDSAVERAAQKNVDEIMAKTASKQLTIDDLPKWAHNMAYKRFGINEIISFIPLILIVLTSPMLGNRVNMGDGLVVSKNALFIIPFLSLLISGGCWFGIHIRRKSERITDIEHFSWNEIFSFLANIFVVAMCTAVILYQLFRAFTA